MNKGKCELCGHVATKAQMSSHLVSCPPGHDHQGLPAAFVQLYFQAAGDRRYWLYIESSTDATLQQVDGLLRRVWLECCGHMSTFRVGSTEPSMRSRVGALFVSKGLRLEHDYDFGDTTTLKGQVLGRREGFTRRSVVRLLARNTPLAWTCSDCAAAATVICPLCVHEGDCLFCDAHARTHPCAEEEVFLPVVNSPRMGVCGYTGAA